MKEATLVFLVKKENGKLMNICLAMKKRGFGVGKWNGTGGKIKEGEKIEEAMKREAKEELGVDINEFSRVARLSFCFPHNPVWDQVVHVYFSENWQGEPIESEEMRPKWFASSEIPFDVMWSDDIFWLPEVLRGNLVKGSFEFGEGDIVKNKEINIVKEL